MNHGPLTNEQAEVAVKGMLNTKDDAPPDLDFWIRHYERELSDIDDMARLGECRKREIGHFLNVLKGLQK